MFSLDFFCFYGIVLCLKEAQCHDYIRELLLWEYQSVVVTRRIRWEQSSVTAPVLMWRFLLSPKSRGFSGTPSEQRLQEEAVGDDEVAR